MIDPTRDYGWSNTSSNSPVSRWFYQPCALHCLESKEAEGEVVRREVLLTPSCLSHCVIEDQHGRHLRQQWLVHDELLVVRIQWWHSSVVECYNGIAFKSHKPFRCLELTFLQQVLFRQSRVVPWFPDRVTISRRSLDVASVVEPAYVPQSLDEVAPVVLEESFRLFAAVVELVALADVHLRIDRRWKRPNIISKHLRMISGGGVGGVGGRCRMTRGGCGGGAGACRSWTPKKRRSTNRAMIKDVPWWWLVLVQDLVVAPGIARSPVACNEHFDRLVWRRVKVPDRFEHWDYPCDHRPR